MTEYKSEKPWTQISPGISAGMMSSTLTTQEILTAQSDYRKSYYSVDPFVGLMATLVFPRISDQASFQCEVLFSKASYNGLVVQKHLGDEIQYHDTSFDLATVSIPVAFTYSTTEKFVSIFFQAGANIDMHVKRQTNHRVEVVKNNVVNTMPDEPALELKRQQIGWWAGVGVQRTFSVFKGGISLRYYESRNLNRWSGNIIDFNRVSVSLIVWKK